MSIDALLKVVKPPVNPVAGGEGVLWEPVERELKTVLPGDYKAYVQLFGSGSLNGYFHPLNPFTSQPHLNLFRELENLYESERTLLLNDRGASQPFPPFGLHPESPGLLPWGTTDNGEHLFWYTVGPPDAWPVVVYSGREFVHETFSMSMSRFLAGILKGETASKLFPEDIAATPARFEQ